MFIGGWLQQLSATTHPSDVVLQASDAERTDDKPELEGPKPLAQWDLPVLQAVRTRVVNRRHQ